MRRGEGKESGKGMCRVGRRGRGFRDKENGVGVERRVGE